MPPPKKKPAPAPAPLVSGERVHREGSDSVYVITRVDPTGTQVDICLEGTNLEWFRVQANTIRRI